MSVTGPCSADDRERERRAPALERILRGPEPLEADLWFSNPQVRGVWLAQRFVELHRTLETPSWALEREALLAVSDGSHSLDDRRRVARRDPALRRACELLRDELSRVARRMLERGVAVDEIAAAAAQAFGSR